MDLLPRCGAALWSVDRTEAYAQIKDRSCYPLLEAFAALFGRVERALFRDHYVRGEPLADCKRRYLPAFGITARMFNAVASVLADLHPPTDKKRRLKASSEGDFLSRCQLF